MYLRADYTIRCDDDAYVALMVFVVAYLFAFTLMLPMTVALLLLRHRKDLHSVQTRQWISLCSVQCWKRVLGALGGTEKGSPHWHYRIVGSRDASQLLQLLFAPVSLRLSTTTALTATKWYSGLQSRAFAIYVQVPRCCDALGFGHCTQWGGGRRWQCPRLLAGSCLAWMYSLWYLAWSQCVL